MNNRQLQMSLEIHVCFRLQGPVYKTDAGRAFQTIRQTGLQSAASCPSAMLLLLLGMTQDCHFNWQPSHFLHRQAGEMMDKERAGLSQGEDAGYHCFSRCVRYQQEGVGWDKSLGGWLSATLHTYRKAHASGNFPGP